MPVFSYRLAVELGKTVEEINAMSHVEYLGWAAYLKARHAIENKTPAGGP